MVSPPSPSQILLPNPTLLVLDRIEQNLTQFRLILHVDQEPACPVCGQVSRSCHSRYCRYLQDLPWQGRAVQLWLTVRRFRCRNPVCPRQIFCERLPGVTQAYGRQTDRVFEIVRLVGYLAGGRAGQRLLIHLSLPTSDDTVLRRIRQPPAQPPASLPVSHLGVDDWAWKRGHRYNISNNVTNRRWQASIVLAHRSWRPRQPAAPGRLQLLCQPLLRAVVSSARSRSHEPALTSPPLAAVGPDPLGNESLGLYSSPGRL